MVKKNGEPKTRRVREGRVNEQGQVVWTSDAMDRIRSVFQQHADGWMNVLTGLGVRSRDKRAGMEFAGAPRISHQRELLAEMYAGDDLVGRIVDLPAQEMYREWIDLTAGTEEGGLDADVSSEILQELDDLGAQSAFADAEAWARLYGGSIILVGVDDGQEPVEPLRMESLQSVDWLTALDRFDVEVATFYEDPLEEKFGLPKLYRITGTSDVRANQGTQEAPTAFNTLVHETRTIRFDGVRTTRRKRRENQGWGDSVLERYVEVIRDFQGASGGIMHLLADFSQGVFKIKGLAKALAADKDGLVLKRLQMLDIARSMVRAVPLDADAEEFTREGAAVAGLADLYDRMMMRVSSATGIPVTLLFGRSPAGLNATGESDIRLFYDHIAALQETSTRPRLEYLLEVMLNARQGPTGGQEPETWNFEFNPLYQESAKEQAETRKLIAEADSIWISSKVLLPDEVALSRFGGDTFSPETMIDEELRAEQEAKREADEARREEQQRELAEQQPPAQQLTVVNQDGKDDAPHYRLQEDDERSSQVCSRCAFSGGGPVCRRFDFVFDRGHTCDDWLEQSELIVIADRREDGKKAKRRRGRGRRRSGRRRGRNY